MAVSDGYREYVLDQLGRIIPVTGRAMFGGVGLYGRGWFFALIADDRLYFKVDDATRGDFEVRGMGPFKPFGDEGAGWAITRSPATCWTMWKRSARGSTAHWRSPVGRGGGRAANSDLPGSQGDQRGYLSCDPTREPRMRLSVAGVLLCTLAAVPNLRAQRVSSEFDPNPAHPFGRPNPAAPPELQQFTFMVGAFDCTDRVRQADGTWIEFPAIWNAHYVLNGWGIQDVYWNPQFATSNIRIFDPAAGRWKVTFFKMPGYGSGVWEGAQEGDRMVMRQPTRGRNGQPAESRLTFYDISASAFRWKSESVQGDSVRAGWTSACSRRR